jgi:hypothetical protein
MQQGFYCATPHVAVLAQWSSLGLADGKSGLPFGVTQ